MASLPLTPDGVKEKMENLYKLSDKQLAVIADIVRSEFKYYIQDNFLITAEQQQYIDHMNAAVADYFGAACAICLRNRLPISLIYPDPPVGVQYAKWSVSSNTLVIGADGNGNTEGSGELIFKVVYT